MSGNILKKSICANCSEFSKINSFCINCPCLMCDTCTNKIHINPNHDIIKFKSIQLQWSNKEYILNLFDDKQLGRSVFEEINRKIDEPDNSDIDYSKMWKCTECTAFNKLISTKCEVCCMFRKTDIKDTTQYNGKLVNLMDKLRVIEDGLGQYSNVSFEHVAKEYISCGDTDFDKWFSEKYLADKDLSIIIDVVEQEGHNVARNQFTSKYSEFVKKKNANTILHLPPSLVTDKVKGSGVPIQLKDINKMNIVPEEMKNKEIDDTSLWNLLIQEEQYTERQHRMIITEMNIPSDKVNLLRAFLQHASFGSYLREQIPGGCIKLIQLRQALLDYMTIDEAMDFLQKDCPICCLQYPMSEMQPLLTCSHEMCKTCFKSWLEETIERKFPCKWGCWTCPEEQYNTIDRNLHTVHLRNFLRENNAPPKILDIFDGKLLNERLMTSEFFHWCCNDQCEYGFEAEGIKGKAQCRSCKTDMCLDCNRKWSDKHEGKTCQEYELLMLKDDPNLANILKDIGIECPNCGMRYALAAGGCLHFDCKACGIKFCGGCYTRFADKCEAPGCTMGTAFHGHHPRNCLYFLRDNDPPILEKMLEKADYPRLKDKPDKECPFIITSKETMRDMECKKVVFGSSGLCEEHYKEYLVQFINRLSIDPMDIANSADLNLMLFQALKPKLTILDNETEDAFVARLRKEVKLCPLFIPKGVQDEIKIPVPEVVA